MAGFSFPFSWKAKRILGARFQPLVFGVLHSSGPGLTKGHSDNFTR
jgi:hypothetical protein